jgi:hypothetical protein
MNIELIDDVWVPATPGLTEGNPLPDLSLSLSLLNSFHWMRIHEQT